jgi:hypothetical protein
MGKKRNVYNIVVGNLKGRDNLEDLDVNGRLILKWNIREIDLRVWAVFIWLTVWTSDS